MPTLAAVIVEIICHAVLAYLGREFSIDKREIHGSWSGFCSCGIPASSCAVKSCGVGSSWNTFFFLSGSPFLVQFETKCYKVIKVCGEVSGDEEVFDLLTKTISEQHNLRFFVKVEDCHIANKFAMVCGVGVSSLGQLSKFTFRSCSCIGVIKGCFECSNELGEGGKGDSSCALVNIRGKPAFFQNPWEMIPYMLVLPYPVSSFRGRY